jgi:hypothetical protein
LAPRAPKRRRATRCARYATFASVLLRRVALRWGFALVCGVGYLILRLLVMCERGGAWLGLPPLVVAGEQSTPRRNAAEGLLATLYHVLPLVRLKVFHTGSGSIAIQNHAFGRQFVGRVANHEDIFKVNKNNPWILLIISLNISNGGASLSTEPRRCWVGERRPFVRRCFLGIYIGAVRRSRAMVATLKLRRSLR